MNITDKKVLVTGGGSGIGKALVTILSERGVKDIAVMGRTGEKLKVLQKAFPSVRLLPIEGDVSDPEDVKRASEIIREQWGALDVLVNNAGVVSAGLLDEISDEDIIGQINVNVTGLILLTKHCLSLLKESPEAAIVNVSSGLGYIGMPFYSVYAATKSAVKHFSEAMRRELMPHHIHVMTVYPTATDTPMMESAEVDGMDTPEEVARATLEGLLHEEIEVIMGGEEQKNQIEMNRRKPRELDGKIMDMFEPLRERTREHRAM